VLVDRLLVFRAWHPAVPFDHTVLRPHCAKRTILAQDVPVMDYQLGMRPSWLAYGDSTRV
jgi:hypothetical protein